MSYFIWWSAKRVEHIYYKDYPITQKAWKLFPKLSAFGKLKKCQVVKHNLFFLVQRYQTHLEELLSKKCIMFFKKNIKELFGIEESKIKEWYNQLLKEIIS